MQLAVFCSACPTVRTMKVSFECIVEMPVGTKFKYEAVKTSSGLSLRLDRPLDVAIPANYGFIKDTLAPDGDPLDIFILGKTPIQPLTECNVRIIGALTCFDNGISDDKIIGELIGGGFNLFAPESLYYEEILTYLTTYKTGFEVYELVSREVAEDIINKTKV